MIYTILLYILVVYFSLKNDSKALKWICCIIAVYLGLRYDYMPDYFNYMNAFERFETLPFGEYDQNYEHFEYGWFVLNKLFAPAGYYTFVFISSCFFSFACYKVLSLYINDRTVLFVVLLGFVTSSGFVVLASAQRQMVATGIIMLAYRYFIYNRLLDVKSLISKHTAYYVLCVLLASSLHQSAVITLLLPVLYFTPRKSFLVSMSLVLFLAAVVFYGNLFMPKILSSYIQQSESYEYIQEIEYGGSITFLAGCIMFFRISLIVYILKKETMSKDEYVVLLLGIISIIFLATSYSVAQIFRLSYYFIIFDFLSIGLTIRYLPANFKTPYTSFILIWYVWGVLKLFQTYTYSWQEYKTILTLI